MKQVIFAIALLAMASLTGCLTDDESSVDETTDTTSDNTGNTNDNSNDNSDTNQDNTDSGDDGMIDPVGTDGGVIIPEDSSIFIDSPRYNKQMGTGECSNPHNEDGYSDDAEELNCEYTYYNEDFFENIYNSNGEFYDIMYRDSDGIYNQLDFNGWLNKTGSVVTIETLVFPDRGKFGGRTTEVDLDGDGMYEDVPSYYHYINEPVGDRCYTSLCEITFYGHGGLEFNADFYTSLYFSSIGFAIDNDNDGVKDSMLNVRYHESFTVTFDLPFEPYAFTISDFNSDYGSDFNSDYGKVHRIF